MTTSAINLIQDHLRAWHYSPCSTSCQCLYNLLPGFWTLPHFGSCFPQSSKFVSYLVLRKVRENFTLMCTSYYKLFGLYFSSLSLVSDDSTRIGGRAFMWKIFRGYTRYDFDWTHQRHHHPQLFECGYWWDWTFGEWRKIEWRRVEGVPRTWVSSYRKKRFIR